MIRQLFRVVGPQIRGQMIRQLVAVVVYAVCQGLSFVLLVPTLRALLRGDMPAAWRWLAVLLVAVLVTVVAYVVQSVLSFRVALAASHRLYQRLGAHVSTLPLGWFSGGQVGRLAQLSARGVPGIRTVFAHTLQPLLSGVVTPAVVIVAMLFLDWRLALTAVCLVPVMYLVFRSTMAAVGRAEQAADAAGSVANERVVEYVRAQSVLRSLGGATRGYRLLDDALAAQDLAGQRQARALAPGRTAFTAVVYLAVAALLAVGAWLGLRGTVDIAELVALLVLAVRFVEPIAELADLGGSLRSTRNSLDRLEEVLAARPLPEPAEVVEAAVRVPADAGVELRDVVFSYGGARPVIDGVSLSIPARTMTAVVGPSGSGKTTLTRLIARFWDVSAGAVRIGGVDVRDLSTEDLMEQVSLVFQDVYLFDTDIRENIRIGRPDATDDEIDEAARLSRVDEIVERLPQGWQTRVGEGGTSLSGGERQRVSLARALVKNAPIVLLDEATAALDPANEAAVHEALAALSGQRTLLVIAHRLSTVVLADQIVFLDGGRISEVGTHEELLARDGRYAAFWRERQRARGWRLRRTADAASG